MTQALVFAPIDARAAEGDRFTRAVDGLCAFKHVAVSEAISSPVASIAVTPAARSGGKRIARSGDGQVWLLDVGTWLPLPAEPGRDADWLLRQYRQHGAHGLARRLQGIFALFIVDLQASRVHVISDRCGSLHVFYRQFDDGLAICTSSAALAALDKTALDQLGVHEFVATGIVYEDRSVWAGIRKLPPASVLTIDAGRPAIARYWTFAEVEAETLPLDTAVDAAQQALVDVLGALPPTDQPLVSDLTGGYDSRFLLAGLLAAGRDFETTVSGAAGHPDVLVAARIAGELGLKHQHVASDAATTPALFDAALRMTDGEYDAFDYARILRTHRHLSVGHGMSLNGSFGELARGYWWELLWPRLAKAEPLDAAMLSQRRFAAIGYDASVFDGAARIDLRRHMADAVTRALEPVAGFPNTTQMDCAYYTLRMQRWQGRIASSTNQLWPACSPIGFAQVLRPILAARAGTRFRSLLVRRLFERHAPRLAKIPLEHGYPPAPATPFNFWRFAPLLGHYGSKVWSRVAARIGVPRGSTVPLALPLDERPEHAALFGETPLRQWLRQPLLLESGVFRPEPLRSLLDSRQARVGSAVEQWRRLVTLECLLRSMERPERR